jgi:hypothetical protein
MGIADQSDTHERSRLHYGGSDPTTPFFLRPQYVKYNSLQKSKDLGLVENLSALLSGVAGSSVGSPTLYFKVQTRGPAKIRLAQRPVDRYSDHSISVGLLDADRNQIPLDEQSGFAQAPFAVYADDPSQRERLPGGTYYFVVSSNQWRETPFEVVAFIQRYLECQGAAVLATLPTLRLALVKLQGVALGSNLAHGLIAHPDTVKPLLGSAAAALIPRLSLAIFRGAATGQMLPYGRLKQTARINGRASGSSPNIATMTSSRPYGGYGY